MSELSRTPAERARKAHSAVLRAMEDVGTARNVAQVLGVSETTVSRIKTDKLEDAVTLLYHLGFKVVPSDMKCFPTDYVQALHTMARMHMEKSTPSLDWNDA